MVNNVMQKYVLNIDRLYTGQTANALVVKQVDGDAPVLLPSMSESDNDISAWIEKCRKIHPEFNPSVSATTPQQLNGFIMEFNLKLQEDFKRGGHSELYMMDDTWGMKPDKNSQFVDKKYMHSLNGKTDDGMNSSQLNVLFPFKKVLTKSMHSSKLKVRPSSDMDDFLERSRGITLQGRVSSFRECVKSVAQCGNNLYTLAPLVDVGGTLYGNCMTVMNALQDEPFHFPDTLTLFQPGQSEYKYSVVEEFVKWYETHNRRTVVSSKDAYGGNVSDLRCLGVGSYELELSTYSPTEINIGGRERVWLDADTFRSIRSGEDSVNRYQDGKYIIDNSILDVDGEFQDVGIGFNLYDTFISGKDRILNVHVPVNPDFNNLYLKFGCELHKEIGLLEEMEVYVSAEINGRVYEVVPE